MGKNYKFKNIYMHIYGPFKLCALVPDYCPKDRNM